MMSQLPEKDPEWQRVALSSIAGYDLYNAGWMKGWVWMAIVARGDGTYFTTVAWTRTRWGARRQAEEETRRLLDEWDQEMT